MANDNSDLQLDGGTASSVSNPPSPPSSEALNQFAPVKEIFAPVAPTMTPGDITCSPSRPQAARYVSHIGHDCGRSEKGCQLSHLTASPYCSQSVRNYRPQVFAAKSRISK